MKNLVALLIVICVKNRIQKRNSILEFVEDVFLVIKCENQVNAYIFLVMVVIGWRYR